MKTLFIGQKSICLKSVESTNSYATEMLRQISLLDGTLFYTFNQTNGRGQRANTWESEPHKNIALSVVLLPFFLNVNQQFLLTQITSLALADLMAEVIKEKHKVAIKWPNDIYINDKKVAGVLIENGIKNNQIQNSIIGVGLNVNQTQFSSTIVATSLQLLAGKGFDLNKLIQMFCEKLEGYYLQLKAKKFEYINQKYLSNLYQINEWKNYFFDNETQEGKIIGVSAEGKLKLELKNNTMRLFDLKEITFIK